MAAELFRFEGFPSATLHVILFKAVANVQYVVSASLMAALAAKDVA